MIHRSWLIAVGSAAVCLAIWLTASGPTTAVLARESDKAAGHIDADDWQPPLTVVNPYITPTTAAPRSPLAGSQVDPDLPPIYRLPSVDEEVAAISSPADEDEDDLSSKDEDDVSSSDEEQAAPDDAATVVANNNILPTAAPDDAATAVANDDTRPIPAAAPSDDSPEQQLAQLSEQPPIEPSHATRAFSASSAEMIPYMPVTAGLSAQQLPSVERAYALAQRGSLYAAQTEFIQVLRRIAQAKDADEGYDDHSRALAAGLRALDEADDFAPSGVQLEAEMNVAVTVSSHRTPVLRGCGASVLPQEAIAQYHCYARQQLGQAVADEQAGSMALHGLGKVYCRLAEETPNDSRHQRKAMTMFLAALEAGPQNHLAANEVGVLLSRGGHQAEAAAMFRRAIDLAPNGTAYHNLAVAEQKLGQFEQAAADGRYGDQLAARERSVGAVSRSMGIQWVTPQQMAGVAQPQPLPPSQVANPRVASRPTPPLGPAPSAAIQQPTHAPNLRWW